MTSAAYESQVRDHEYQLTVEWTGNRGGGTASYRGYDRAYTIEAGGKPPILGSSDPMFRGDASRYNPEELLLAALSSCHMLWYLHLCADAGIVVTHYVDRAQGEMREEADGAGRFTEVRLQPQVRCAAGTDLARAAALHADVHAKCAIFRSVNFPVVCRPTCSEDGRQGEAETAR